MKTKIFFFFSVAAVLVWIGLCFTQSPKNTAASFETNNLKLVVETRRFGIYTVTIDGTEYIVAKSANGISICPKLSQTKIENTK